MHELAIARDLFMIVEKKARENNLKKVTKVRIKLGVTSGIKENFLRHSFIDHIFPETIARDAELEIIKEGAEARCRGCGKDIDTQAEFSMNCPACGSFDVEIRRGKDTCLEEIEGIK